MSEELKPCPFCGRPATASNELSREMMAACNNPECMNFGWGMSISIWNTRPREDALRARAEKVEIENERLRKALDEYADAGNWTIQSDDGSLPDLWHGYKAGPEIARIALKGGAA